jgi:hypothetical protein
MPSLVAAQHFFSSVPADQSPTKRRGYQTLFRTRGLSDEVVRDIEDRAQYVNAPGAPVKHQFYVLPGNLLALSCSVALAELDEFGRKGRYLSHTLVIDHNAFQQLGRCPIDVLTQFKFATTLAEVFAQGQTATAEVQAARFNITVDWHTRAAQLARQWPPEKLTQAGRFAWRAKDLADRRESIAVIGADADQLDVFALLFWLASPVNRHLLSFDTHAAGCDWNHRVVFWAQGFVDRASARSSHVLDIDSRTVASTLSPADDGPYAIWLTREVLTARTDLTSIGQSQIWAAHLESILAGGAPVHGLPVDFVEHFARLNHPAVVARWLSLLPPGLSSAIVQIIRQDMMADPGQYLEVLADGTQIEQIHEVMFNTLLMLKAVPARSDRQILEKWIKTTDHAGLQALVSFWSKDGKAWLNHLKALPTNVYVQMMDRLVHWPQPPIALWEALTTPHVDAWLRVVAPFVPPGDWKKVLQILEQADESLLVLLSQVVLQLPLPVRDEIARWLKGYKGEAYALRQSLGVPLNSKKRLGFGR